MRVSLFIIGIYLMITAVMGNSECVWGSVKKQATFVPWMVGIGGLYLLWNYVPEPYDEATKGLIGVAVLGLLIVNIGTVKSDLTSAWDQIKNLAPSMTSPKATGA